MLFISDTKLHHDAGSIYKHKLANCTIFTDFARREALLNTRHHALNDKSRHSVQYMNFIIKQHGGKYGSHQA